MIPISHKSNLLQYPTAVPYCSTLLQYPTAVPYCSTHNTPVQRAFPRCLPAAALLFMLLLLSSCRTTRHMSLAQIDGVRTANTAFSIDQQLLLRPVLWPSSALTTSAPSPQLAPSAPLAPTDSLIPIGRIITNGTIYTTSTDTTHATVQEESTNHQQSATGSGLWADLHTSLVCLIIALIVLLFLKGLFSRHR